jgi:hypothetical protein
MADQETNQPEDPEAQLRSTLPREERENPDPALQLSRGRIGARKTAQARSRRAE